MTNFGPAPERIVEARRTKSLARKINLLLDVIRQDHGRPFEYRTIKARASKNGYELAYDHWYLLINGKAQLVPNAALIAIAGVFDVNPDYLLKEEGELPEQVEAELELLRSLRRAGVRNFSAQTLGPVGPEALKALTKMLDEELSTTSDPV